MSASGSKVHRKIALPSAASGGAKFASKNENMYSGAMNIFNKTQNIPLGDKFKGGLVLGKKIGFKIKFF